MMPYTQLTWKPAVTNCGFFYFYFFLAVLSSVLYRLFSSCREWGLLSSCASHCGGFPYCRAGAAGHAGFGSCGSQAPEYRLSSCGAWAQRLRSTCNLPGPGIKSSLNLLPWQADSTTGAPEKPQTILNYMLYLLL